MVQWQHTSLWSCGSWFESRCPSLIPSAQADDFLKRDLSRSNCIAAQILFSYAPRISYCFIKMCGAEVKP